MSSKASHSITSVITGIFKRNGGWLRLQGELAVYYWPRVAGQELGKKVDAMYYRNGNLMLQTDNPALAHQITLLIPEICARYRRLMGSAIIKGIKVKIGPIPQRPVKDRTPTDLPELDAGEAQAIASCAHEINDPELESSLVGLMTSFYRKRKQLQESGAVNCQSCGVLIEPGYNYCPCCERQLNGEIAAYLAYLKEHQQEVAVTDLQDGLTSANQQLITQILKFNQTGR